MSTFESVVTNDRAESRSAANLYRGPDFPRRMEVSRYMAEDEAPSWDELRDEA